MKCHSGPVRGRFGAPAGETVFRGHFRHTIDPKGRLSIPAKFREVLREAGSDRLVMAPHGTGLDVVLDPHGRIQILQDYRERGGLSKNVVIIGMMDHFEIWDDDRWAIYQREQAGPLDDLRERLAQKGV